MLNKHIPRHPKRLQAGSTLLEALVAILLFSMGIIALMGLQAVSIKNSIDAKYRADASYFANQIIAQMWVDRANIDSYAHHATAGTSACTPTGAASTLPAVTGTNGWTAQVTSALPGATADKQSIVVTEPLSDIKQVTVTVCWKSPQETTTHNFVTTAQINEN